MYVLIVLSESFSRFVMSSYAPVDCPRIDIIARSLSANAGNPQYQTIVDSNILVICELKMLNAPCHKFPSQSHHFKTNMKQCS